MKYFFSALLLMLSIGAVANEQTFEFDDPAKRALFQDLTKDLRCPKCQNQNIADSDAMIAFDLRRKVYQLVQQGQSKQQIIDYMKQRYGDFVYYQPPVTPTTVWLWVLPVVFIAGGVWIVARRFNKPAVTEQDERLARAEQMLEQDK